jgi:hypothetical protein
VREEGEGQHRLEWRGMTRTGKMVARVDGGGRGLGGEDRGRRSWAEHLIARAHVFGCQLLPVYVHLFWNGNKNLLFVVCASQLLKLLLIVIVVDC